MRYDETVLFRSGDGQPKLIVYGDNKIREYSVPQSLSFGRASGSSRPGISMENKHISRRHGSFEIQDGVCTYMDEHSTNGTFLNGVKLAPGERNPLKSGDVLSVLSAGGVIVRMLYTRDYNPDTEWKRIRLTDDIGELTVGRAEALGMDDRRVSRHHASFFRAQKGWAILDNDSLNGVWLNGTRLTEPAYLHPSDIIVIAGYIFLFTGDSLICQIDRCDSSAMRQSGAEQRDGGVLSINIVERSVWNRFRKQTLLRDINLDIHSGELVLILGGSGAGKTTFMKAVMGYEPAQGHIFYNDMDIYNQYKQMMYEIGYVPQQELMRMNDTVYHTLLNAAHMRLPVGMPEQEYIFAVDRTLATLGLERERDSQVSKLSGGQKKRLSIAIEYIGNPSLFFLDEPDSGLDGSMATGLMQNLRTIADEGKIVMVISHYPDRTPELFDKIIVLAKDTRDNCGHLVFYGSPQEAKAFFETDDLESIVRRINRPDEDGEGMGDYFIEKFSNYRRM